ncbi:MAG: sigma 54-interacting transcriptional regulator, partial [Calditrichaeota bacterium]|nr:sigma 54-interacting transcriptional regulator [Calditrichota bacterium]
MIGSSPALRQLFDQIRRVAPTDATVLITSEHGTGKELVARAIYQSSRRKATSFIKVNCAAIPAELLESELFGHRKGAFTGAVSDR